MIKLFMQTREIISSQFKYLNNNFKEYFNIFIPLILLWIINYLVWIYPSNFFSSIFNNNIFILPFIIGLISALYSFRVVVNIHRLVILNEPHDYYAINKRFKETILYIVYSIIMFLVLFLPMLLLLFLSIIPFMGFLTIPIIIIWTLMVFPFFALNLPMAAIGKKVLFFKMFQMSKGFRLTLFLQMLCFWIVNYFGNLILFFILTPILNIHLTSLITYFMNAYLLALYISCLSKTYILWEQNYKK